MGWMVSRIHWQRRLFDYRIEISELKQQNTALETEIEKERRAAKENIAGLEHMRSQMEQTFKAVSTTVLRENNQSFLDLANVTLSKYLDGAREDFSHRRQAVENLIEPVQKTLNRYDAHVNAMELAREKAYGSLSQQVVSLIKTQDALHRETGRLVKALRLPHVRGRWGEMTLKRVAELAGMHSHCDFRLQPSAESENGIIRPDMVVHLPGNRHIIVDAKAPLSAYLDALEAEDEQLQNQFLSQHAGQIRAHMHKLSQKAYWAQFDPTPEFVVLFIPGENFFSAALEQNPDLIEDGIHKNIIPATPTTLISLLKTVAFSWRQEATAENSLAVSRLGRELYHRLCRMADHIQRLGREIDRCTQTYNRMVGSFEHRVLSSAKKFNDMGIYSKSANHLETISPIETRARDVQCPVGEHVISWDQNEDKR